MGWWITLGILFLLAIFPIGVSAKYDADGAVVKILAGPFRYTLLPARKKQKEKKKRPSKAKKEKRTEKKPLSRDQLVKKVQTEQKRKQQKAGGSWTDFLPLVLTALDFLGVLPRKIRVNLLEMKLVLAGDDPCDLGINYGRTWAAVGNLLPRLEKIFDIRKRNIDVECDFTADTTLVTARLDLTITFGRALSLIVTYAIRALIEFIHIRKKRKGGATK